MTQYVVCGVDKSRVLRLCRALIRTLDNAHFLDYDVPYPDRSRARAHVFSVGHAVCTREAEGLSTVTTRDESGFRAYAFGAFFVGVDRLVEGVDVRVVPSDAISDDDAEAWLAAAALAIDAARVRSVPV